jgi:pimeloyl-ACP methyl ester carboxylesterase
MAGVIERRRIAVSGAQPRLAQAGPAEDAEAVVFIHGNPGSADEWEPLVSALGARGRRAVAFDLPDFGATAAPPGFEHTVASYAEFIAQGLGELGVERAHIVLHDFGGPFGLAWAAAHPDALASVTLIGTGLLPGYRWHNLARIWRTPVVGELFQAAATKRAFRLVMNRNEPRRLPRDFVDDVFDRYDRRTRRAVLKLYRDTDDPGAISAELTALMAPRDLPALVIWGEHDAYLPSAYAWRQRDAFPSADVHVLTMSGHWPHVDAPDTVERLLLEFLDRVPSERSSTV